MEPEINGSDRFVSQTSFREILDLLKENRSTIRDQVTALSQQLTRVGEEITKRQDKANGRMQKAEDQIETIQTELAAVKDEVTTILEEGCQQRGQHVAALNALAAAGAVPAEPSAPKPWKPTPKQVAIGGGLMGGGALLMEVLKLAQAWLAHLHTVPK